MSRAADTDGALWRRAMHDVRPLARRRPAPHPLPGVSPGRTWGPAPDPSPPGSRPARLRQPPHVPPAAMPPLDSFAGLDRRAAERLRRGQHRVEARLDLHGMTQSEAHRALGAFLHEARAAGWRCVLVITGRGSAPGGEAGVLRAAVPRWLEEPAHRPHLLAIATARPRDGGSGALYVMLRRARGR